ncbi:NACHT domain-containing protein, partial [Crocosphaera sp. Alani8]|uniref:NACHT domain-containing protein n=1 Tax=Crocosphaera sp. Alani8 TaxID=3038952 RepID=UPI00313D39DD
SISKGFYKGVKKSGFGITLALISSIGLGILTPILTQNSPSLSSCQQLEKSIKTLAKTDADSDRFDFLKTNIKRKRSSEILNLYRKDNLQDSSSKKPCFPEEKLWTIYDQEYDKYKSPSWLPILIFTSLGIIIGGAISDTLKNLIKKLLDTLIEFIYQRTAGILFRNWGITRYRKSLVEKYEKLSISFRTNKPLEMREVYVPLKVKESDDQSNNSLIEAEKALGDYSKLMVVGSPGAGKSVLLKHLTLSYAEQGLNRRFYTDSIPILLELNKLKPSDLNVASLETKLVDIFSQNDFPNANNCVKQSLKDGRILLLFDGLDEVIDDSRSEVVKGLKNFLDTYKKCPFIITCRTAVYRNEFYDTVNRTLEIKDFNDQQVRRFLRAWKTEMPQEKSVEKLLRTLNDKPQIKTLAKNPLLLTIIAYLYADTNMELPDSRAEFYRRAIDILSETRDEAKGLNNKYKGIKKQQVLQRLALYAQTRTNLSQSSQNFQQNRRTISDIELKKEVKEILPNLNLKPEDTDTIIDEIVDRSGLLLRLDGGQRYEFAHQTLQEYFVASALKDNYTDLVEYWRNSPNDWQEIMKLWCGLANNSTDLIKSVEVRYPLIAFECLGDANFVEKGLAEEIIDSFKDRLGQENNERIEIAFGFVAASSSERGNKVFQFLGETLNNADSSNLTEAEKRYLIMRRKAAAKALAQTNKPEAAEILAQFYSVDTSTDQEVHLTVRECLQKLGNLAIPTLINLAKDEDNNENLIRLVLEDIISVGTPEAAIALLPFLWDSRLMNSTAWCLGHLIKLPEVEDAFKEKEIDDNINSLIAEQQKRKDYLDWVWDPFDPSASSNISIIAGRIAYLLLDQLKNRTIDLDSFNALYIDPRLMIPMCAIAKFDGVKLPEKISSDAISLLEQSELTENIQRKMHKEVDTILIKAKSMNEGDIVLNWSKFLLNLPSYLQLDLLRRLIESRRNLTLNDWRNAWRNLYAEIDYQFFKSKHYLGILFITVVLSLGAIGQIIVLVGNLFTNPNLSTPTILISSLSIITLLTIINFLRVVWKESFSREDPLNPPLLISLGFFGVKTLLEEITRFWQKELVWEGIIALYDSLDSNNFTVVGAGGERRKNVASTGIR